MASKAVYYQLVNSQIDTTTTNDKKIQNSAKVMQAIQPIKNLELSEGQVQDVCNLLLLKNVFGYIYIAVII